MQRTGRVALQALALDMKTAYLHAVHDSIHLHHALKQFIQTTDKGSQGIYMCDMIEQFWGLIWFMNFQHLLDLL